MPQASPIRPTLCEIMQRCATLAEGSAHVTYSEIGPSFEGRPIPVLKVGDVTRDLPVLMITGGTHGCEEVGREIAMTFAEWLAGDGAANLAHLSAVVVPCLNPDGTERNSYHNAQDINVYKSYSFDAPSRTPEGRAAETLAAQLLPDCYVDSHGLAGGAMGDSEYVTPTLPSNQGVQIGYAVAAEMNTAAEALGFPQREPWQEMRFRDLPACLCDRLAILYNTLGFTLETTENYYPLADSARSGMARLRKLVEIGRRRHWNQPYPGFPCDSLSGGPMGAVMAFGTTYRARRESRRALMALLNEDERTFERSHADPEKVATLLLRVATQPADPPEGIVLQLALDARAKVTRVTYRFPGAEGELAPASLAEAHSYTIWRDGKVPMVRASIARPVTQGEHRLVVEYEGPYEPHVTPTWREFSYERRRK